MNEQLPLDGRIAVVTGAAGGVGASLVRTLAARGARVVAVDVDADALDRLVSDVGIAVVAHQADVSDLSDWQLVRDRVEHLEGRLAVLVNNAGVLHHQRLADVERDTWAATLDVNLKGTWLGMKVLAPALREAGGGSIVNVSSAAGLDQHPDAAYTASKWGVRGLTKTAAQEFGEWGVRVNSIHPGYIQTGMGSSAAGAAARAMLSLMPIARPGAATDVAELVAFLVSDAAAFITGAEIAVDGGWTSGVQMAAARRSWRETKKHG